MSAINFTIEDMPPIYGTRTFLPDEVTINNLEFTCSNTQPFDESEGYEVLSVKVTDPEFASYNKKYNKNAF
jgi:hypothetical protein